MLLKPHLAAIRAAEIGVAAAMLSEPKAAAVTAAVLTAAAAGAGAARVALEGLRMPTMMCAPAS
jgi:hypothetical protein